MDQSKKKDQNKSYYERNKQHILERAKQRAEQVQVEPEERVVSLFDEPKDKSLEKATKREKMKTKSTLDLSWILLFALVALMTGFLFHETAKFFWNLDKSWAGACVKAAILEGAAIALTLMPARNRVWSALNALLVACIYAFGIWAVSYPIMNSTHSQIIQSENQNKTISEFELEISKKEKVRDQYWKQDRPTLARRLDQSLDGLRTQLMAIRNDKQDAPSASLVQGLLISSVFFRVLVVIAISPLFSPCGDGGGL